MTFALSARSRRSTPRISIPGRSRKGALYAGGRGGRSAYTAALMVLLSCSSPRRAPASSVAPDVAVPSSLGQSPVHATQPHAEAPQAGASGLPLPPLSREALWAAWNSLRGDAYDLDSVARFLEDGERLDCSAKSLVRYSGKALRYQSPVYVHAAFLERLARFEQLVVEVGTEIYGRAPTRLRHAGAFSCRPSRRRVHRLSEHALGNAIDVLGFDFGGANRRQPLPVAVPKRWRAAFQIRIARDWSEPAADAASSIHTRFLHALAERLAERSDVFRGMIGPGQRDHADHFHLDMAPWRYVRF
jgi:hypothetical protein